MSPVYTYRCQMGHEWDEVRTMTDSETSEAPCSRCLENADARGVEIYTEELPDFAGKRVPSHSVSVKVQRGTPKFYPNKGPR